MKKRTATSILVMLMLLTVTVAAVTPRTADVQPRLSFSGTTANCSVNITGDSSSDKITVTLALWQDGDLVDSWYRTGTGSLSFSETVSVTKGETYTLTADATINGAWLDIVSVEGTC